MPNGHNPEEDFPRFTPRPEGRDGFTVAFICALPLEADAIQQLFDHQWSIRDYGQGQNDPNNYFVGAIANHPAVVVRLPGIGKAAASAAAASLLSSFSSIRLAILVGICGAIPWYRDGKEIVLGDVIISDGVIQADFGRQADGGIVRKGQRSESLGRPNPEIRAVLATLKTLDGQRTLQSRMADYLGQLQKVLELKATYPGTVQDKLFDWRRCPVPTADSNTCVECDCEGPPVQRARHAKEPVTPVVHIGLVASGDQVHRSGKVRDQLAEQEGVLGFEMEGAGAWDIFPCVVIKGVCDYADRHKTKGWQHYAAATAAACAKAFLYVLPTAKDSHQANRQERTHRGKDNECLKDLRITDPRHDKARIVEAKGGLLQDAYCWILDNAEFRQWCDGKQSRLLWIKGDPGKGKTMLLCGIIDKLQTLALGTSLLSFFFCQATDTRINSATAILRGLIYLLLDQQPSLIPHVRKKYDYAGKAIFEDVNGWFALSEMFTSILQDPSLESVYLVIDALDECENDLPKLLTFIKMSSMFPRVKWIVSSRNWSNIEESLMAAEQKIRLRRLSLELNEESVSSAVHIYIQHKVAELARLKGYNDKTRDAVQNHLTRNANGTFLWVALVCQELTKITRARVLTKLNTFPPGLGSLYQRMMDQIRRLDEADLCKQVLAVLCGTYRPITIQELTSFVDIPEDISDHLEFLTEIVGLCGSFLTLRESTVYFVHQSAKDFLLKDALDEIFPSGVALLHYGIFSQSLHIMSGALRHNMYDLATPGFPIGNVDPPDLDPLAAVRYACVYWADHLHDWQSSDNINYPDAFQDGGIIDDFLRQHYLHWLEALSLCRSMSQAILSMAKLESILKQKNIGSQLSNLVYDMRRFVQHCSWLVENHPLQVYASALVFSPARSMTRNLFKREVRWITAGPVVEEDWNACTQTLEGHSDSVNSVAFSPDSKLVASGSSDKTVKIWDAATGACTQTLEGHIDSVNSVAFSPDSKLVASGSEDKTVKIWDAATGACTQTLEGHSDWVRSVAFSPDSKLVASGSEDRTVKIWDAATGACTQTLEGHSDWVNSVAFSPDSKLVASGSEDRTVKIWDAATGACTQTLEGHIDSVNSVAFSPDSKLVASGSEDWTVKIWDAATGACTQTLENVGFSSLIASWLGDAKNTPQQYYNVI